MDRILCATDYPFPSIAPNGSHDLLRAAELSDSDCAKIGYGNWETLCANISR